jgi:putative peptidoglycan lipid II flippase
MGFLKSAFTVSFFTLISRILGFVRDILLANFFGNSIFSDAFFTAFKLPNLFRNISAEGAFNSAFVPIFSSKLTTKKQDEIVFFAKNIFSFLFYILLIFVLIAEMFMPFVITITAPGFTQNAQVFSLTVNLAKIMFPYLLFISLVSMMSGILNSFDEFASVSACPIILNLTFIFAVFLSSYFKLQLTFILAWGVFISGILQFFWLFFFTIKRGIILYPIFPKIDKTTKKFFKKFLNGVIGSSITQINSVVSLIIATMIPQAVSYLYYADRIIQFPLALIGTALGTGILPILSKNIAQEKHRITTYIQDKSLFIALLLGIPAAFGLFYLSNLIISVLFERGRFTAQDTIAVANVLKIYAIGLPAFILIRILHTIFFAKKDTKTPMKVSSICFFINLALNLLFIKPFGYIGIAIATVIASFSNIALLFYLLHKQGLKLSELLKLQILKIFYCSVIMILIIIFMNGLIDKLIHLDGFWMKFIRLSSLGIGGFLVYFLLGWIIGLIRLNRVKRLRKNSY